MVRTRKPRVDRQVEAIVAVTYRALANGVSINLLDLPEIFDKAYQAGVGAKYTSGDLAVIVAAVSHQMEGDIARLKRP